MSKIIVAAAKHQRKAMEWLYEQNKKQVFFTASRLLCDAKAADEAVVYVFKTVWNDLQRLQIMDESEFSALVMRKTADWCKRKIQGADPKAFRMPQNRNFILTSFLPVDSSTALPEKVLASLPPLHRCLFVLYHICDYDTLQIAGFLKTDLKTVQFALDAETGNLERLLRSLGSEASLDAVIDGVSQTQSAVVSEETDAKVRAVIDELATPVEKARKIRTLSIACAAAAAVLAAVICICIFTGGKNTVPAETDDDTETTTEEEASTGETTETIDSSVITTPVIDLDENAAYYADIEIEGYGTITVLLEQNAAPVTVANFINLAQSGFYDGLTFHRIIEGFMMQGGDPNGDGTGGADADILGEFADNGYDTGLTHTAGAISMARSSDYNSASSQFFITQDECSWLDGQYAVFGYVTQGMDIVNAVCTDAQPTDSNGTIAAEDQPVIVSITIRTE